MLRIRVWDENPDHVPASVYPLGLRETLVQALQIQGDANWEITPAHLDQPAQGLADSDLARTDVLIWWGHRRHAMLEAKRVSAICEQVRERGMGLIALHSAHYSQPFQRLLETSGDLDGGWRVDYQPEWIRICAPWHPIAEGLTDFILPSEEMYGAPFQVPAPDCVILQSYFPAGGESFPSGLVWERGPARGRIFYFRPGHETCPSYHSLEVQRLLVNAVRWAAKT